MPHVIYVANGRSGKILESPEITCGGINNHSLTSTFGRPVRRIGCQQPGNAREMRKETYTNRIHLAYWSITLLTYWSNGGPNGTQLLQENEQTFALEVGLGKKSRLAANRTQNEDTLCVNSVMNFLAVDNCSVWQDCRR